MPKSHSFKKEFVSVIKIATLPFFAVGYLVLEFFGLNETPQDKAKRQRERELEKLKIELLNEAILKLRKSGKRL